VSTIKNLRFGTQVCDSVSKLGVPQSQFPYMIPVSAVIDLSSILRIYVRYINVYSQSPTWINLLVICFNSRRNAVHIYFGHMFPCFVNLLWHLYKTSGMRIATYLFLHFFSITVENSGRTPGIRKYTTLCLSCRALWYNYIILTNKMHTFQINVLIKFFVYCTCFEHHVFINRKTMFYV